MLISSMVITRTTKKVKLNIDKITTAQSEGNILFLFDEKIVYLCTRSNNIWTSQLLFGAVLFRKFAEINSGLARTKIDEQIGLNLGCGTLLSLHSLWLTAADLGLAVKKTTPGLTVPGVGAHLSRLTITSPGCLIDGMLHHVIRPFLLLLVLVVVLDLYPLLFVLFEVLLLHLVALLGLAMSLLENLFSLFTFPGLRPCFGQLHQQSQ